MSAMSSMRFAPLVPMENSINSILSYWRLKFLSLSEISSLAVPISIFNLNLGWSGGIALKSQILSAS
jgi:hypothetical protein